MVKICINNLVFNKEKFGGDAHEIKESITKRHI